MVAVKLCGDDCNQLIYKYLLVLLRAITPMPVQTHRQ